MKITPPLLFSATLKFAFIAFRKKSAMSKLKSPLETSGNLSGC